MPAVTYVEGAQRMLTAGRLVPEGLYVRFADDRDGVIPFDELKLPGTPHRVVLPRPHVLEIHLRDGSVEEVPWDFARHFADDQYRAASQAAVVRGRQRFGERLRALRSEGGLTQEALARRARVSRVTIARIETGEQLPRYQTVVALAKGLAVPAAELLSGQVSES